MSYLNKVVKSLHVSVVLDSVSSAFVQKQVQQDLKFGVDFPHSHLRLQAHVVLPQLLAAVTSCLYCMQKKATNVVSTRHWRMKSISL